MRKVIKISLKVLSALVLLVIIVPLSALLLLNVEGVQNFAVRKASEAISENLGTTVSMERIGIRGFNRVAVRGFYVEDLAGDTLLYAHDLSAVISKTALLRNDIVLGGIKLDSGKIYLYQPAGGQLNIQEIVAKISGKQAGGGNTKLTLDGIEITNVAFKYQKEGEDLKTVDGINYGNMILRGVNAGSRKLRITGKRIAMDLHDVSFTDISGFRVTAMSVGRFTIDTGFLDFDDTRIETPLSNLALPRIILKGGSWKDFADFENRVRLDVTVEKSELHSKTLSYFIPALTGTADIPLTGVELTFEGTVNDFGGRIANLTSNGTRFEGDYTVRNLRPAIDSARFSVDIAHLATDGHSIENIVSELSAMRLDTTVIRMLARAGHLSIAGKVDGRLSDFDADITMDAGLGDIALKGGVERSSQGTKFDGDVKVDRFDVGYLLGNSMLGRTSADVRARGSLRDGRLYVEGNAAVPALEFNGYSYGNIRVNGSFNDNVASGRIEAGDDNLTLDLVGRADLRKETIPQYDLTLDLKKADLHRLNINRRDSVALLSGLFVVNGSGSSLDNINGTINIDNLLYVSPADSVHTGGIVFTGRNSDESKYLAFNSSFLDAEFVSRMSYDSIIDYLGHVLYDYIPALEKGNATTHHIAAATADGIPAMKAASAGNDTSNGSSRVTVNVKQANKVAAIFLPGFNIAEDTRAELMFNPNTERLSIEAKSNFIEYDKFLVTKLDLKGDNYTKNDSLSLVFITDELMFPGFSLPSSSIYAQAAAGNARVRTQISNPKHEFGLSLDMDAGFGRDDTGALTVDMHFQPSSMTADRRMWSISDDNIRYCGGNIAIDNFRLTDGTQGLFIDGTISANGTDTLTVSLNDLTLSPLSNFTEELGYTMDGTARGKVAISSTLNRPVIDGEVMLDNMIVNGIAVTPLRLGSRWNFGTKRASLFISDRDSGKDIVRGYYRPSDGAYTGDVDIAGLPFAALDPLLGGAVRTDGGTIDIKARVRSSQSGNTPLLSGNVQLNDLVTTVQFNKAAYTLRSADISITDNVAALDGTTVFDSEGHRAELRAGADLSNLSAISYNASLTPENIIALNTGINDNDTFYGKVYASGTINVKGDKMGVKVGITATTSDNSSFFMPLSGRSSVARTDFIVFESKRDTPVSDENVINEKKKAFEESRKKDDEVRSNVNIGMELDVLPNTSVTLMLDREQSNVMSARGTASLNMAVNPTDNEFSMYGTYEISEGDYMMNFQGLIANKLEIQPGGTIQWTGDPANAILDVSAVYRLRASPDGLLDPNEAVGRVPIECAITITGRLSEPRFAFSINAPTLDADQQSRLAAALSSEETITLQFMSLVALGSFYINENATMDIGSAGASAGIGFLTNKFSDLISSDRMRFTVGYRAQDTYSSSEVDIGFSTEINDRVSVEFETNFDTGDNAAVVDDNDIMHYNVTVTGLINKAGNLRAKAFTRVIDRFDYRGLQETGVGVYYREDFDRISDIGRNAKERKARRKQERAAKREAKRAAKANGETPPDDTGGAQNADGEYVAGTEEERGEIEDIQPADRY